jgi:probable O-glycosylation ligase (exosortase A-associated)
MRDLLLIILVGLLCIIGLVKPKIGVFGYTWFAMMRPDVLAFADPANSYSFFIAVCTLAGSLPYMGRLPRLFRNPIFIGLLILEIPVAISSFAAIHPELSLPYYWVLVRALVMALLIPIFIESVQDLRILLLVMAASFGFIGVKFGLFGLLRGGVRMNFGYDNGMLSGNNEVGMALAMILPICYYSTELLTMRWQKLGMIFTSFCTAATIVMTYSRGSALALGAVAFMIIKRSQRRMAALVVIAVMIVPTVYLVGPSYLERLDTIKAPTEEGSAASRIEMAKLSLRIWQDYPLLGIGYGRENFRLMARAYGYTGPSIVAHNTYTEVLVDSGIFAFLFYVGLMYGTILWLGRSARRMARDAPHLVVFPVSLQIALIAYAVNCAFISRENFDFYYMLLMAAAAWYQIAGTVEPEELALAEPLDENSLPVAAPLISCEANNAL